MEHQEESLIEIHLFEGRFLPKEYQSLVQGRWKRSFRHCNQYAKLIDAQAYYSYYGAYVPTILSRENTVVRLAMLQDDHDVVLGFSVIEKNILHYVEVKKDYRRNGIGQYLVPERIDWFTHITKIGMRLWSVKAPNAKWSPYI